MKVSVVSSLLLLLLLLLAGTTTASVLGKSPHPASPPSQSQQQLQPQQQPLQVAKEDASSSAADKHDLKRIIDQSPLLSFHRDIVEIVSISGNEADVGEFIIQFLQERDFKVEKQVIKEVESDDDAEKKPRFNIYAYPASSPAPPKILLTSHIDTVPPFIPYSLDLPVGRNGRDDILISGRGSVDAKASVAAQVFAVLEYLQTDPDASLGLLFVVGEERGGTGMKWFSQSPLNTSPPSFHTVIFGEPTDLALVAGHKGVLGFTVIAKGQAAHSGYPWLGSSAVSAILPALARLDQLGDIPVEEGGLPSSEKLGKTTLNIGHVVGGVAPNVVPASAYAEVIVRLAVADVDLVKELIVKAVDDATGGNENVTVEFIDNGTESPPVDFDTDVEGFNVTTVNYGTDAFHLHLHEGSGGSRHGRVRRYLYGPGNIFVAHGDHEGLPVWQIEEAVRGYKKLIDAAIERNKE
ncbi:hypothetical protein VTN77DRAFT_5316 [Rasamsonia byssochlamydoides]|uniref:uncharacterized protein n=1 Tax=Rasamsonia byssochlamydoides TaxID=89139 RepID=UPI0037446C64